MAPAFHSSAVVGAALVGTPTARNGAVTVIRLLEAEPDRISGD